MALLPELVNTICYFLTDCQFDMLDNPALTPARWYSSMSFDVVKLYRKVKTDKYYHKNHYSQFEAAGKMFRTKMLGYLHCFFTISLVCRDWHRAIHWAGIGRVCHDMVDHVMLRSKRHNLDFTGGGWSTPGNNFLLNERFSDEFYRLALIRFFGREWSRPDNPLFALLHKERRMRIRTNKDKLRIDWSKRDRRPTKKPRRE